MRIFLVVAMALSLLFSSGYYSQIVSASMMPDPISMAYPGTVPPKNLPSLPPDQRQPKELPPTITVTSPPASRTKAEKACAEQYYTIRWSYFGDIGGAVNIKLSSNTIATNVAVQGGQGYYSWKVDDRYAGKGIETYTVIVEAVNGAAVGTGGTIDVYGSKVPCSMK